MSGLPIRHPRIFTRTSDWSGQTHELVIWMTDEQFAELESPGGRHIQEILPDCSPTEREFLLTGMSAAEQHRFFGEEAD